MDADNLAKVAGTISVGGETIKLFRYTDDEIDEILGLRMGADDYVTKPFSQRLLLERIRSLLRRKDANEGKLVGDEGEDTKVMVRGELSIDPLRHSVTWKGLNVTLTVNKN